MPPRKTPTTLTPREARFCAEYIVDYNATQAAIRAGYSPKSAGAIGKENLHKPLIHSELQKQKDLQAERTGITADKVLRELAKIAMQNHAHYLSVNEDGQLVPDFSRMTPDDFAAVSTLEFDTIRPTVARGRRGRRGPRKGSPQTGGVPGAHASLARQYVSKIKMWDKGAALGLLSRHFNLLQPDSVAPPPADDSKRAMIIKVLVSGMDTKAQQRHAVAVQVEEGPSQGALRQNVSQRTPAAQQLIASRQVTSGKPPK